MTHSPRSNPLTARQIRIIALLAAGHIAKEIAVEFGVSVRTIEKHIYEAHKKLGTRTSAGLVAAALRKGLIE